MISLLFLILFTTFMKRTLIVSFFISLVMYSKAQLILPVRDSLNRKTITFYDYNIIDKNNVYFIRSMDKTTGKLEKVPLTGRYLFEEGNSRTIDIELKDGIATGDWQYYTSTFQGPIISSTVSFIDGYKNGTENIYSYEWNKETERFESYLRRVIQYNMGKKAHDISYWPDGQVSMEYQFDEKGKPHGTFISFNPNGSVSVKGCYSHGNGIGKWEYFDYESKLTKEVIYKDGFVHTTTYHSNGNPHIIKSTRNRVYENHFINLTEKGDTIAYKYYKDGIECGYQIGHVFTGYWSPSATSYYYTNDKGVIYGPYLQRFTDTGRLRVKGQYNEQGIREGIWEYYQEDGRMYRRETIENGWVKASYTRWLTNKAGQYINAQYHLETFPTGAMPRQVEETPFFLFSE